MKLVFLAATMLGACVLDTTPIPPDVVVTAESNATVCSPLAQMRMYLAADSKLRLDQCRTGPYFWSEDETTKAVLCSAQSNTTVHRQLGIQRRGLAVQGRMTFDHYACQFNVCDWFINVVTCDCDSCWQVDLDPQER